MFKPTINQYTFLRVIPTMTFKLTFPSGILSGISSVIFSGIFQPYVLAFILAYLLTAFLHSIWQTFWHIFWHSFWRLRSGATHSDWDLPVGSGDAHCDEELARSRRRRRRRRRKKSSYKIKQPSPGRWGKHISKFRHISKLRVSFCWSMARMSSSSSSVRLCVPPFSWTRQQKSKLHPVNHIVW